MRLINNKSRAVWLTSNHDVMHDTSAQHGIDNGSLQCGTFTELFLGFAQPMRDGVTLQRRLSLAECKPRISPDLHHGHWACVGLQPKLHDDVMTWNTFFITGATYKESTGRRWNLITKDKRYTVLMFFHNLLDENTVACDLRRPDAPVTSR